jgi:sodium-dependent phosphate cotransporter
LGIIFLVICLGGLVKVLKSMLLGGSERIIKKVTAINGYFSMAIGCGITMAVQSSKVTTSVLTPIVGVGIVSAEQMYPLTLGANIGTTITSILAALVAETSTAMQVALAHFFFNIFGIIIWYPVHFMRAIPIKMCKDLGKATRWWRGFPFLYTAVVFFLMPLALLGLSSLFISDSKALFTLGSLLVVFIVLFLAKFLGWWFKRDGRAITKANFQCCQYKNDIMAHILDEWDPLVLMVDNIKSEVGIDVEDHGDIKKPANNKMDPITHSKPTFHDK